MSVDKHIYKQHNKTALLYHIVCPVRYRRKLITESVSKTLKNVCVEISKRYEMHFKDLKKLAPIPDVSLNEEVQYSVK